MLFVITLQTRLSNTAIDNPTMRTKETIINSVLEYLATDTIWLVRIIVVAV